MSKTKLRSSDARNGQFCEWESVNFVNTFVVDPLS